jgi:hypothetical protein
MAGRDLPSTSGPPANAVQDRCIIVLCALRSALACSGDAPAAASARRCAARQLRLLGAGDDACFASMHRVSAFLQPAQQAAPAAAALAARASARAAARLPHAVTLRGVRRAPRSAALGLVGRRRPFCAASKKRPFSEEKHVPPLPCASAPAAPPAHALARSRLRARARGGPALFFFCAHGGRQPSRRGGGHAPAGAAAAAAAGRDGGGVQAPPGGRARRAAEAGGAEGAARRGAARRSDTVALGRSGASYALAVRGR